jgi:flagellar hook-associated protein 1 FlgK
MGLSVALSNALSGMRSGQNGLDVLSRNVANAGVPGYHRQSLSVIETQGANSTFVRNGVVTRAFNQSLTLHYSRALSDSGFSSVRANFVDRLQMAIGKPGTAGSLDTAFANFQAAMSQLAVSPDDYAVRADAVAKAGVVAATLNDLSAQVQTLRRETEAQIATRVEDLNQMLSSLEQLNGRIGDLSVDPTSRAALLDQRDRLVSEIAAMVDIRTEYRPDGTVALMTRTGAGLLDNKASVFEFQSAGAISATSQFDTDPAQSGVGTLMLRTPAGLVLDLVQQNVLKSGELGGLIELRDKTLVTAQDQLDDIAAALAQAMSTVETAGTAATSGAATGFSIDLSAIRNGNDFELTYMQGGIERSVRVVRVDDPTKLPMDVTDADGNRVIGLDFSGGAAAIAPQLQGLLGSGFAISATVGGELQILDYGAANATDVLGLKTRTTVTATQGAGLALSLFVDAGNADFTDALDGLGQRRGFAARITVNEDVIADMTLMVQFAAGGSLGDDDRADYLLDRLDNMRFASYEPSGKPAGYRLAGSVGDLISQVMNHQGNVAATAINQADADTLTLETLTTRMDAEYGVDVDEEMARLMELQNAYAANARVLSTVQELLDQLMAI